MASDSLARELPVQSAARVESRISPEQSAAKKRCQGSGEVSNAAHKVMVPIRAACCVRKAGLEKRERAEE